MLLEYLKEWFVRTWLGERVQGFWRNVKFYAPLFNREQREVIWPKFKELLQKEGKISILWRTIMFFVIAVICLICAPFCVAFFRLACIVVGIFGIVINPFWTMWSFRKIFHETDRDIARAIATEQRKIKLAEETRAKAQEKAKAKEQLAQAAAQGSKDRPASTLKPRRKPLHP